MAADVEMVAATANQIGEGPVWLPEQQRLLWVDITGRQLLWFDPRTDAVQTLDVGRDVGAVVPAESGKLMAAVADGFLEIDPRDRTTRLVAAVEADQPGNRMNDGKCDSRGRFWAGTMGYDLRPNAAALYRLEADCTVQTMLQPVSLSNGIDWSLDDRLMYYVDSTTGRLDVFDYDPEPGLLSNRRTLVEIPRSEGLPDGLTVDAEGCIWLALWGGGAVRRLTPAGKVDRVVRLPVSQVTSCAFGGSDLEDLYITSAAENVSEPGAGGLFRCRPGVKGRPAHRFAGCA
ncbi:MAG TPA: SMP-30/gluconolactonase/LRE family protein [Candidatus Dormibacteraeota bacterium]